MQIKENVLSVITDREVFLSDYTAFAWWALDATRLVPVFSKPRIFEAHGAWLNDLSRLGNHEKNLSEGLDHFKHCGHLSFWLRRLSPIVEFQNVDFGESERPMNEREKAFLELIKAYANEYVAFEYCFQICRYYEMKNKEHPSERAERLVLSPAYYQTVCHFLKYKSVSPHAMHLIYKSIFYFNGMDDFDPAKLEPMLID
jgi:hypothetical protein